MPDLLEQRETWDAVVVGAGPAGSLAARQLALGGRSVLLVDRAAFPRGKVCGCCLNGQALFALRAAGLPSLTARLGAWPLTEVRLAAGGRHARLPLPAGEAVSREALDAALVDEAVAAGATFWPATAAYVGEATAAHRRVSLETAAGQAGPRQVAARVVLAADGLSGQSLRALPEFAPRVAVDARVAAGAVLDFDASEVGAAEYRDGTIYLACGRGGYLGLVRLEDGRLDVAAAFDRAALRRAGQPAALAAEILRQARLPVPRDMEQAAWRGTPPLTRRRTKLAGERLFLLGDAAGYVEPFTGEGMAWAMTSALLAAPLAYAAIDGWTDQLAHQWEATHRRAFGAARRRCRTIALALRSPALAALGVVALSFAPWLAGPVVRRLNRPPRGLDFSPQALKSTPPSPPEEYETPLEPQAAR